MEGLQLRDFLLYTALVLYIIYTMKINNMIGVSRVTNRGKIDVKEANRLANQRKMWVKALHFFEWVCYNVGSKPEESYLLDMKYRITRVKMQIEVLGRNWKATELHGCLKTIQLGGFFFGTSLYLLTKRPPFLILYATWVAPLIFQIYADDKILVEDKELEQDFPDLFLLLHTRLLKGASVRLAPTLDDYVKSLDAMYQGKSHKVIRNFVVDLRNNIEIYGDDSMAVFYLREMYRSSMVINFCNLATQSLKGVNNADKLLAFKIELMQQKQEQMTERAKKLVEKGQRSILLIYFILGQFVVLSWVAKMGTLASIK